MYFLQASTTSNGISLVLFMGILGMLLLTIGLVLFIIFHQRKIIRYQFRLQQMEQEQQKVLLNASIRLQEEERQRLAADLHDDAGPLLATARLYLNENLVNLDKTAQLQSIYNAKQIIDDTIQLIRNISHSLMPPTLKNFGLESAVNDLFQKLSGSKLYIRMHHDGRGLTQTDFEKLNKSSGGLGLKNIQSRLKLLQGRIFFEKDMSQTYYKVTIEVPKTEEMVTKDERVVTY